MNTAKQQVIRNMENRRNINSWNRRLKCWGFQAVLMCILLCFLSGCNLSQDDIVSEPESETVINNSEAVSEPESGTKDSEVLESEESTETVEAIYELGELPPMENKYFAEYGGNIYFRQYNADSFMEGALWAGYEYTTEPMVAKNLMCMDAQGNISKVGTDYGYGVMYIMEDASGEPAIYSVFRDADGCEVLYSCDLTGGNIKEHARDDISLSINGVCENTVIFSTFGEGIQYMDTTQGVVQSFVPEQYNGMWLDANEKGIYTVSVKDSAFHIKKGTYDGTITELEKIPIIDIVPDFMVEDVLDENGELMYFATSYEVTDVDCVGDKIYFVLEGYAGTGHFPQGGALFVLDTVTDECKRVAKLPHSNESIRINIVEENGNIWVCCPVGELVEDDYEVRTECFLESGDENAQAPSGVNARFDMGELVQDYYSYGGYAVYATPDTTGYSYIVLSEADIDSLDIDNPTIYGETNGDVEWNVVRAEYVGDKLFFSVEISDHDQEQNIGWRDFYIRRITYDYYKDLSTGEIVLLQSY